MVGTRRKASSTRAKAPMPRAADSLLEFLREAIQEAVAPLAGVGRRKLLVSVGWTVNERIFTFVTRQGRIVVRLPDEAAQRELSAIPGAEPWKYSATRAGPKGWLLLPEAMHDDAEDLRLWLKRAWALNGQLPARKRPAKKKTAVRASRKRA